MKSLMIFFLAVTLAAALEETLDIPERIINGTAAAIGQFPYQVGLLLTNNIDWFICGGSLISSTWVLTAAHCTDGMYSVEVHLGGIHLGGIHWEKPDVSFTVDRYHFKQHEKYDNETHSNDIALIEIPPVEFTDNIQKIELPKINGSYPEYTGEKVVIVGWGDIDDNGNNPVSLLFAEMTAISNEECSSHWIYAGVLQSSMICARPFNGGNICGGDSGGPMVLKDSNILIGVTSFALEICEVNIPSVFTRVTSYLDWIAEKTGIEL